MLPEDLMRRLAARSCVAGCLLFGTAAAVAAGPAFNLVRTIELPEVAEGPYSDQLELDLAHRRLFVTAQASKAVEVVDLDSGKIVHSITGLENPHAVLYRADIDRIYVGDGNLGVLNIYDGRSYNLLGSVKLQRGADIFAYDPDGKLLYVSNGGMAVHESHSLLSIIDTTAGTKVGDIEVDSEKLEAAVIESGSNRIYVNLPLTHEIAVLDRVSGKTVARWPVPGCRLNVSLTLDDQRHLLYTACRNTSVRGSIVVLDATTGSAVAALPAEGWIHDLDYDVRRERIYASSGFGHLQAWQRQQDGSYKELAPTDTAILAKTSIYSPELDREFVSVPHLGFSFETARILVFRPFD